MSGKSAALRKHLAPRFMSSGGDVEEDSPLPGGRESDEKETPGSGDTESEPSKSNSEAFSDLGNTEVAPTPSESILDPNAASTEASPISLIPQPSDADKQAAMLAYLQKQYGAAADSSGVNDAVADSKRANLIAGVGRGLQQMAQARGVANGLQADYGAWDNIEKHGKEGVSQAQAARSAKMQDFMAKHELSRQATSDARAASAEGRTEGAYAHQQTEWGREAEDHDPTSKKSQMVQGLFVKSLGSQYADDIKGMSAADLKDHALQPLELKAKLDSAKAAREASLETARARMGVQAGERQKKEDIAFSGRFEKVQQAYSKASAEADSQEKLLQEAAHSQNGIAGNLVKGGALHTALGRVSQGELAMAVDPSIAERAKRLWESIDQGKTLTDKDVQEYQAIQHGMRSSLEARFKADADQLTGDHDRTSHSPPGYAAGLVGYKGSGAAPAAAAAPAPHPDSQAVTWAKANPNDPRAAKILQINGAH